jgi:hypothetical protein
MSLLSPLLMSPVAFKHPPRDRNIITNAIPNVMIRFISSSCFSVVIFIDFTFIGFAVFQADNRCPFLSVSIPHFTVRR